RARGRPAGTDRPEPRVRGGEPVRRAGRGRERPGCGLVEGRGPRAFPLGGGAAVEEVGKGRLDVGGPVAAPIPAPAQRRGARAQAGGAMAVTSVSENRAAASATSASARER